jgi:hypothetical protein
MSMNQPSDGLPKDDLCPKPTSSHGYFDRRRQQEAILISLSKTTAKIFMVMQIQKILKALNSILSKLVVNFPIVLHSTFSTMEILA